MWLLIGTIAIVFLTLYLMDKRDDDLNPNNFSLLVFICAICTIPTQIALIAIDNFGGSDSHKILAMFLTIITFALLAVWSIYSDNSIRSNNDSDKQDIASEAIIMTTVLSNGNDSKPSNSSKNNDDFFLL